MDAPQIFSARLLLLSLLALVALATPARGEVEPAPAPIAAPPAAPIQPPATSGETERRLLPQPRETILPNLYIVTIGVSIYQRPELSLTYPAKDARDMAAAFSLQQGRLYNQVRVRTLVDEEATQIEVVRKLEWLQRHTTARDVAVLFLAGHGINDPSTGEYHFLTHDADPENVKTTMVSQHLIQDTLRHTAGKVLLLLDTCHSGNVFPEWRTRDLANLQPWVQELSSSENGVIVFTASTGRQASKESDRWGNGAFTKAVVEGLLGEAAYHTGRPITVNMLEVYISERVKELTHGSQTPTVAKPATIPDFPIALPWPAGSAPGAPAVDAQRRDTTPLYKKWWLWAGVGAAVGIIAIGVGVGVSQSAGSVPGVSVIIDLQPKR